MKHVGTLAAIITLLMGGMLVPTAGAATPSLSVASTVVTEGATLNFVIRLSARSDRKVSVGWATQDLTATAPDDYTAASGRAVIKSGKKKALVQVATVSDTTDEPDETMTLALSAPRRAKIAPPGTAVGTIIDDDLPPAVDCSTDDGYEENDAWGSPASAGTSETQVQVGGKRCAPDDDFFQATVTDGDGTGVCFAGESHMAVVTLTFVNALGDLDMQVRPDASDGTNGTYTSAGEGDSEQLQFSWGGTCGGDNSRTFYVRVYGYPADTASENYSLTVTHTETES